ncbi:MAG: amidohydrolase [Peptococcaceae bacterium]|nr:amidohydrolase [Peptococcaceae bacterium]
MKQLYYNGNIVTMNEAQPKAEAVLLQDGIIVAVGSNEELLAERETAHVVNLDGATVLPGFIDSHSHFSSSYIFPRFDPSPVGKTDSVEDLVEQAREYLEKHPVPEGEWFIGMGYDHALFKGQLHPTKEDLDRISTEVPIVMINTSGFLGVVNTRVLDILGITKDTPNPEGGYIYHDPETGEPTGLFQDLAIRDTVLTKMPTPSAETMIDAICRAEQKYISKGYTTVMDGSFEADMRPLLQFCTGAGLISADVLGYVRVASEAKVALEGVASPEAKYRTHFKISGAKVILDGSPQIRTAWMTKPYYQAPPGEAPDYCGLTGFDSEEDTLALFKECMENRWQLQMQCNGDAAIDRCLKLYEQAVKETGITEDLRPVMIHCQTIREDQIERAQELGIMLSFFHDHVYYWGDWYRSVVLGPERASRISPLAWAAKRGMRFTLHQDCPIGPPNVMLMLDTAVNRRTRNGNVLGEEFAVDIMTALKAVTIDAAYQCFDDDVKGSLEVGKRGDMVVLDQDILTVPKETIRDIKVLATIKDGEIIYQADDMECVDCITEPGEFETTL